MSSSPPSDALDLEAGIGTTSEDAAALARLRRYDGPPPLEHPQCLAPAWPTPADLARRPTAKGRKTFEL